MDVAGTSNVVVTGMLKISYTSYKEKYHSLQHNLISCHPLSHFIDAIMVWLILMALQLIDCIFFSSPCVFCTICCELLWGAHCVLSLQYTLTFISMQI